MTLVAESTITITQGPQDVRVEEGQSASFPCSYTGTNDIPIWFINNSSYSTQGLPERHTYFNKTVTIHDVKHSDNGTTYWCMFLSGVSSSVATLTVLPATQGRYQLAILQVI